MIAKDSARKVGAVFCALTWLGAVGSTTTWGQQAKEKVKGAAAPAAASKASEAVPADDQPVDFRRRPIAYPVKPGDPAAVVNNQVITKQRLADEVVARQGEEILKALIQRTLIQQALVANKLAVTAEEIDEEIDREARSMGGVGRVAWLRTIQTERGISPVQYADDIVFRIVALKKLAAPRVQVTEADLKESFEARYGDKLRCRIIMVDKERTAIEIWEALRKNPGGFERLAMDRSMDTGSRANGGLLVEPISRHAFPQTVSDAAFHQLVDGDFKDAKHKPKDTKYKPKDGDITGPIQVAEATWILLRREGVIPAANVDPKDEAVHKEVFDMIYQVKLKEEGQAYMARLMERASIENVLTGHVKAAGEWDGLDKNILQAAAGRSAPKATDANGKTAGSTNQKTPTPAALSADVLKQSEELSRPPVKK